MPRPVGIFGLLQRLLGGGPARNTAAPSSASATVPKQAPPAAAWPTPAWWLVELDDVLARDDWRQLPRVLDALAQSIPEVVEAGELTVEALEACVPTSELPKLEALLRDRTIGSYNWFTMPPTVLAERAWRPSSVALMTMHASGYMRESAVKRLDGLDPPRTLAYLLLRLNDWVEPVRAAAESAVRRRVIPERTVEWIKCLSTVAAVTAKQRADHSWLWPAIASLVSQPEARTALDALILGHEPSAARAAVRVALSLPPDRATPLLAGLLKHRDPVIRLETGRHIRRLTNLPDRKALLGAMAKHPFMPVRREALHEMVGRPPEEAKPYLLGVMLDRHPTMRHAARVYLRNLEPDLDPRAFYVERLRQGGGSISPTVVAAVGETGRPEDVALVEPYLGHPSAAVAAAAVRSVWALGGDQYIPVIQRHLADPRPSVGSAAAKSLRPRASALDWASVRLLLRSPYRPHTRRRVLHLRMRCHPFDALPDLIAVACGNEPGVTREARDYLAKLDRVCVSYGPTAEQAAAERSALKAARGRLPGPCEAAVRRFMPGVVESATPEQRLGGGTLMPSQEAGLRRMGMEPTNSISGWANLSAFRFGAFVDAMVVSGWEIDRKAMVLSPEGDEFDWKYYDAEELPTVLRRLEERGTFMGIAIQHGRTGARVFARFNIPAGGVSVLFGAGCPEDPVWGRVVDPRWALQVLQEICTMTGLRLQTVEFSVESPM